MPHVSLIALPDATLSTLAGLYDVLGLLHDVVPENQPFEIEIVAPSHHLVSTASGLPLNAHKTIRDVGHTDIVIVPSFDRDLAFCRCAVRVESREIACYRKRRVQIAVSCGKVYVDRFL